MRIPGMMAVMLAAGVAPAAAQVANGGFERGREGALPAGWRARIDTVAVVALDSADAAEGKYALRIARRATSLAGTHALTQVLPGAPYRGKRIRLSGQVRTAMEAKEGSALLWLRVDRPKAQPGFFDNMQDRPINTSTWARYEIVADVDEDADSIALGFMVQGNGTGWVDDVRVDVIPESAIQPATAEAAKYLDEALDKMQSASIKRDSIAWPAFRANAHRWARGATKPAETYSAVRRALRGLGDKHSFFMPPRQTTSWQQSGAENRKPIIQVLPEGIGYVEVFSYGGGDAEQSKAFARAFQAALRTADSTGVCGWVVDLRRNGGGNMWPMMAGVGPILGDGLAGKFVSASGTAEWGYRAGDAWVGENVVSTANPEAYTLKRPNPPVAVLTSGQTASSGEAVTVAFRARPNTRSFGQPTAGLSTANSTVPLSDGAMILLTTAVFADRTDAKYGDRIAPDEVITTARVDDITQDATVTSARAWLRTQQQCR